MADGAPRRTDPFSGEVRFRVPLPILIPLGAIAVIAAVTIGISRVLLAIPPEAATAVALATAVNILIACAVIAGSKRLEQTSLVELSVIVLYPILIGVVIALLGIGEGAESGAEAERPSGDAPATGAAAPGPADTVVTENFAFEPADFTVPAGEETEITLENRDSVAHNIYIYGNEADREALADDRALFQGDDVGGNASGTYTLPALDAGDFPYLCRIHPFMVGTITAE